MKTKKRMLLIQIQKKFSMEEMKKINGGVIASVGSGSTAKSLAITPDG